MKRKDILAFIALAIAWGSSFLWIKIALEELGPLTLVAYRLFFGIVGLLVVYAVSRPKLPKGKKIWQALVILGLINTAIPFFLINWGETHIDSGMASILNGSVPLFTAVIAHFTLDDDKMTRNRTIALTLGFIGVFVLLSRDLNGGVKSSLLGQGAVLLAALLYAFSAVFARARTKGVSPIIQALGPIIAADAFIWLPVLAFESPIAIPTQSITWVAVLWLGFLGSCIAYLLYFYLIHSIGPTRATMVTYTFPVIGVFLGVVFLKELVDITLLLGGALVLVSIILVNKK